MKARIKATGDIVEVMYSHIAQDKGNCIIWYTTSRGACFSKEELEFIDIGESLDYWTKLEHQYAGMAMQGILSNANHALWDRENNAEGIAKSASAIAHALVEKYKKEE